MSKNQKPFVGARIPQDWMAQLQAIAQESGKTQSEIIQEALGSYLGKTTVGSVSSLNQRVAALERKIQKLTALMAG